MITTAFIDGVPRLAIAVPEICNRERLWELREGLLDLMETCLATEDAKEATDSVSIFIVLRFIRELINDLSDDPKKRHK